MKEKYAFPVIVKKSDQHGKWEYTNVGMELRDYFAAKAMQGILANSELEREVKKEISNKDILSKIHTDYTPKLAYEIADAMIKESGKK